MKGSIFVLVCFLALVVLAETSLKFAIEPSGKYTVSVNNNAWLASGDHGFRANGLWFSTSNQKLTLKSMDTSSGSDKIGEYKQYVITWTAGSLTWLTSVNDYTSHSPVLVFTQTFPQYVNNTASGDNKDVISAFPSFSLSSSPRLNYYTYQGTFLSPKMGKWGTETSYPYGADAGVPLNLFDEDLNSLMISPLKNFMVGIHSLSPSFGKNFVCGLQGKIMNIPAGFTHSTIITASSGVNNAFNYWGSILLDFYGKKPAKVEDDFSIQTLGYWTDNGAYYYYLTEPGKNYADTMIDVDKYISSLELPFRYYQFDSWWYFKGPTQGISLWEPRPDIFPNGMKDLQTKLGGKPLVLHNRWFEPDNQYFTKMKFPFINEAAYSLPLDAQPYEYMMSKAKEWGMIVYEQDWLVDQFLHMEATQNNVLNAHNWMINMNSAAVKNGVTIQLCMPLPNHVLQTVLMSQVTQIRASGDYQRGAYIQWAIGYSSMVHHALGLFPFKDDFWSTNETQTGCTGPQPCTERFPELQALVSALSAGPVGPSDKIGIFSVANIMATTRNDGILLKPDVPAVTPDFVFSSSFDQSGALLDPVSHTYSRFNASINGVVTPITWHYLLAANTDRYYTVSPTDLQDKSTSKFLYFDYFQGSDTVDQFDEENPILIPQCPHKGTAANYIYYVAAPVLQLNGKGYTFLGETKKFVTASSQRITNIQVSEQDSAVTLTVSLVGGSEEVVTIEVANSMSVVEKYECNIRDGAAKFECVDDGKNPTCGCN